MLEKKPIRVLFLLPSLNGGGAERVAVNVLNHANREQFEVRMGLLRRAGPYLKEISNDRVDSSHFGQSVLNFDSDNRESYKLSKVIPAALLAPLNTWWMIKKNKPDVVVSFLKGMSICTRFALLFYGRSKTRWIAREGNNALAVIDDELGSSLARRFIKFLLKNTYRSTDILLTISKEMGIGLARDFRLSPSKVASIHNAINVERIKQKALEPCSLDLPNQYFVAVGRLDRQKGFDVLIKAFARIAKTIDSDLVIIGEGSEELSLRALAEELGVGSRVHMTGFLDNPWSCMAKAQAFVLSSRWEGFGNVVAEALACALPCIVTDCDFGPKEIIEHDVHGLVVATDNEEALAKAMLRLQSEPELKHRLKEAGEKRANDFSVDAITKQYEALFLSA
ncbi:MAG: glycosyltransferase [Myxococcales bacterium]|nr:MAG: glycosyltransferase [Myxococcales bacterium]